MMGDDSSVAWAGDVGQRLLRFDGSPGLIAQGVEFLRLHAGTESHFYKRAAPYVNMNVTEGAGKVAPQLLGWADYVEALGGELHPALASRTEAATDLMEQVQQLLDDNRVLAAAPVVLAGAALEEYLRGPVEANGLTIDAKPGLATYAAALRKADVLTKQHEKDIIAIGGLRNSAARGEFDDVTRPRALLMADQVNWLLSQKVGS